MHSRVGLGKQAPGASDPGAPVGVVEAHALNPLSARRRVDEAAAALVDRHVNGLGPTQSKEEQVARPQRVQ